jgi:hypothetical protein
MFDLRSRRPRRAAFAAIPKHQPIELRQFRHLLRSEILVIGFASADFAVENHARFSIRSSRRPMLARIIAHSLLASCTDWLPDATASHSRIWSA